MDSELSKATKNWYFRTDGMLLANSKLIEDQRWNEQILIGFHLETTEFHGILNDKTVRQQHPLFAEEPVSVFLIGNFLTRK